MNKEGAKYWSAPLVEPPTSGELYSTLWLHREDQASGTDMFIKVVPVPSVSQPTIMQDFAVHHFPTKYTPGCWTSNQDYGVEPNTPPHFKPINLQELQQLVTHLQTSQRHHRGGLGSGDCYPVQFERSCEGSQAVK